MISYFYVGNADFENKSRFDFYNLEYRVQSSVSILTSLFSVPISGSISTTGYQE